MSLPKLGHVIIVNNVAKEMPGSMEDVKALKAAFLKVGFNVEVYTDMSKSVSVLILMWCKVYFERFYADEV